MKIKNSNTAFTLIELIVSSLLVAVVTLGIFSINRVLNNNNVDYGQKYLVKSQTQTTLNHILNNAALAYGSANPNDQGVLIGAQLSDGDLNSFCIHQLANNNLINSASDIWLCYSLYPAGDANYPYQIRWCPEAYSSPPNPRGAGSCAWAKTNGHLVGGYTDSVYLGTAFSITNTAGTTLASSPFFISVSSPTPQLLFSINILNCLNNATPPGTCNAGANPGTSSNPSDNPEVQLSGSVIPLQVSS